MERQQQQNMKAQTANYASNKNIPKLLGTLMEELVVHKPEDPVAFMIEYLKQPDERTQDIKLANLKQLIQKIRSNNDPQVTLRDWLQEINRGTFAKNLFPFHSNQLLKEYQTLADDNKNGEDVNDEDFFQQSLKILALPAIDNSFDF